MLWFLLHLDPIKAASQQESLENARRRLQEQHNAKAAKFMEDRMQVRLCTHCFGDLCTNSCFMYYCKIPKLSLPNW